MKLHLPKQLFTALLAAITLVAPAVVTLGSAAWGYSADVVDTNASNLLYSYSNGTTGGSSTTTGALATGGDGSGLANSGDTRAKATGLTECDENAPGFTVSVDVIDFAANNWTNFLTLHTNNVTGDGDGSLQLQKNSSGQLMVYANSLGGSSVSEKNINLGSIDSWKGQTLTITFAKTNPDNDADKTYTLTVYKNGENVGTLNYTNVTAPGLTGYAFGSTAATSRVSNSSAYNNATIWSKSMTAAEVQGLLISPYVATLNGGETTASDATWTGKGTSWESITNDTSAYLQLAGTNEGSTLIVGDSAEDSLTVQRIDATANNVTVKSAGSMTVNELWASSGATLSIDSVVSNSTTPLTVGGAGSVTLLKGGSVGGLGLYGTLNLAGDTTLSVNGAATMQGSGKISGGTLEILNSSVLTVHVEGLSQRSIGSDIRIASGSRMEFLGSASDTLDYNAAHTVYLEGNAELALGATRQTSGNWTFDMTGGTISGQGVAGNPYALDFHKNGYIKAHAMAGATDQNPTVSTVSASIKSRDNEQLNLVVDANARLDLTGNLNLVRPVEKSGAGLAVIKGTVSSLGEVKVSGGTLELQSAVSTGSAVTVGSGAKLEVSAGASTLSGSVTNNGIIAVSGEGSLTLKGQLSISSGASINVTGALNLNTGSTITLTSPGVISGGGTVHIMEGTTLFIQDDGNSNNNGTSVVKASTIHVHGGGFLKLGGNDLLGWSDGATGAILLQGDSALKVATLQLGGRQTMKTDLIMQGNALVSSIGGTGESAGGLNAFKALGAQITVTGKNNIIDATLYRRDAFLMDVTNDGDELEVKGRVVIHANASTNGDYANTGYDAGSFVKKGAGKLTFSYTSEDETTNTFDKKYLHQSGTTLISGKATFAAVEIQSGMFETSGTVAMNGSINNSGTFKVSGGTATIGGAVTNSGAITVSGGTADFTNTLDMAQDSSLSVSGGTATIGGAVTNSGAITVSGGTADFTNTLDMAQGSSLSVSDGSATLSGAVTNNGAITVSSGTADFTNTLDMAQGSSLSVSGGAATLSGAMNVTGSNVQIEQSGEGSLTLTGNISIAENAAATLSGTITLGHTITNDGSLTLNGTIYLSGDIDTSFAHRAQGSSSYVDINGDASTGNNGFLKLTSASYWLTQSSNGEGDTTINFGDDFATLEGNKVIYQGNSAFQLDKDTNGQLYFSTTGSITGTQYYISTGDVKITSDVQSKATGYTLQGGNMQITTGVVNTSAITYTAGTIELSDGAQLKVDALLGNKTAADLLTGIVTATPATEGATPTGKLVIATNDLATGNANLTTTFKGTLELAENISFTLGAKSAGSSADSKEINTTSLTGLVLNDGSTLHYTGNGVNTQFANTTVNGTKSAATFDIIDGNNGVNNAIQFTEETMLNNDLNLTSEYGARINIAQLAGGGTLTASGAVSTTEMFYTSIESLNGFTGSLIFTDTSKHEVTISTGTGSDSLSFTKLQFASGTGVTNRFNVQKDTTVGTISGTTTINIEEAGTLHAFTKEGSGTITLTGSGTYVAGKFSAVNVTTTSLQDSTNWTGTVLFTGNVSESTGFDNSFGNVNSTIEMKGAHGWFAQNKTLSSTIKLTNDGKLNGFTVTAASSEWLLTISGAVTGNGDFTISQTDTDADPNYKFTGNISGWSGSFVLNETHSQTIDVEMTQVGDLFAAESGGIKIAEDSVGTLEVKLGSANAESVTNMRGSVINESDDAALNLTVQGNTDFQKDVTVTSMTVNAGKTATMNATLKADTVNLADQATISGGTMSKVQMSSSGISGTADGASVSNADVQIAQLAADASFTIEDMTLTNTTITAATVDTHVDFKNVSGDVTLKTGIFGVEMTTVGRGGSALTYEEGAPSITLSSTDAGAAKLMISANPTVDVSGSYGTYTLTFNLNLQLDSSLVEPASNEAWGELVGFSGWLGTMLEEQGAIFAGAAGDPVAQSTAPSVSYGYSAGSGGSNVGTLVITINGLNVPEPTTSTLSLLALAGLCARRRRK